MREAAVSDLGIVGVAEQGRERAGRAAERVAQDLVDRDAAGPDLAVAAEALARLVDVGVLASDAGVTRRIAAGKRLGRNASVRPSETSFL
jgi:hypothetical protein